MRCRSSRSRCACSACRRGRVSSSAAIRTPRRCSMRRPRWRRMHPHGTRAIGRQHGRPCSPCSSRRRLHHRRCEHSVRRIAMFALARASASAAAPRGDHRGIDVTTFDSLEPTFLTPVRRGACHTFRSLWPHSAAAADVLAAQRADDHHDRHGRSVRARHLHSGHDLIARGWAGVAMRRQPPHLSQRQSRPVQGAALAAGFAGL